MNRERSLSRRIVCAGIGSAMVTGSSRSAALAQTGVEAPPTTSARRLIALDWGVAETLVALGHPPLGAAEIPNYDRSVVAPRMPAGVIDVGLRLSPNPELIQALRPDAMLINPAQAYMRPSLLPLGAVQTIPIYTDAGQPYRLASEAAVTLGALANDVASADALMAQADAAMADAKAALRSYDGRPVYMISFVDGRYVSVCSGTSLVGGVFDRLGLRNAWTGSGDGWGMASVGVERLASEPEARVIYRMPVPEDVKRTLAESPLWRRLPFVRERRVVALPPYWAFGGLPSAMRVARLLGKALAAPDGADG